MADNEGANGGSYFGSEAHGIDADYEAVREKAERELAEDMAGPKHPLAEPSGVKNPDGEFAVPAAMVEGRPTTGRPGDRWGPGPLNPQGFTPNDPEGQQGTNHPGGQPTENDTIPRPEWRPPMYEEYRTGPLAERVKRHVVDAPEGRARIFKEGNAWCVCGAGFEDPVVSAFGCGETPEDAYARWLADAKKRPEWKGSPLPAFEDFVIESDAGPIPTI